MSTTTTSGRGGEQMRYRLGVQLPPFWSVLDAKHVDEAWADSQGNPEAEMYVSVLRDLVSLPLDITAFLTLPLPSRDGGVATVLMAAMTSETIPSSLVPPPTDATFSMQQMDGLELEPGKPSSYLTVTHPVVSDDGDFTSLLTFCSPNLPLAPLLEACFASVAKSAHLHRIDQ